MYLSATNQTILIQADATSTVTEPMYSVAFNDHTSAGMTLPQGSSQGSLTGSSPVTAVSAPAASTTRQIAHLTVYNADTGLRLITVTKDVGGTPIILVKAFVSFGSTLQFSRESGWTIINTGQSAESYIITEFTSSGQWNKPVGLKAAIICCVGGGGGGGSGRTDIAGTNRFGGGGGGGGGVTWRFFAAASLASTVTVTVGAGGAGGAGIAANSTNGNNGITGGETSFGSSVISKGGTQGGGGGTSAGTAGGGGANSAAVPQFGPYAVSGISGTAGATTAATTVAGTAMNNSGGAGGAGGQGISNTNVSGVAAATGGGIYNNGSLVTGPTVGNAGASNQSTSLVFSSSLSSPSTLGLGTGGAGGNSTNLNGTAGGNYGAGGGGGAGTLNGTTSGAGGAGGGGLCLVLEIF